MNKNKILIIEDEEDIRDLMQIHLNRASFDVVAVPDGETALKKLVQNFNAAVVDWMLPGISGLELISKLRTHNPLIPILMVTARAEPEDIIKGLETGADDYITKPFELSVFMARIKALLRRSEMIEKKIDFLDTQGLKLDESRHKAFCDSKEIQLTISEFKLLAALLKNQGKVLTRTQLINLVQGSDVSVIDRTIDTHVFGIRKKIEPYGDLIETVRGVGYRMKEL